MKKEIYAVELDEKIVKKLSELTDIRIIDGEDIADAIIILVNNLG